MSAPQWMHAVEISQPGGPEVLRLTQRPVPTPGVGEMRIEVVASGLNRPDILQRKGLYPPPPGITDLPGLEVAGHVAGGDPAELAAAGWSLGDPVCALLAGGGYAQWAVAPLGQCLPVPTGWSLLEAAGLPETLLTVWGHLVDRGTLQAGETVLIQGGSSGIGVMAIQLARALGARVMVTAGTDVKCQACLALGAEKAVNYTTHDFAAEALAWTEGQGVDVIVDIVGGDYVAREVPILAPDGRLLIVSLQGGAQVRFDAGPLLRKRLSIRGSALRVQSLAAKAALVRAVRTHAWSWLCEGTIRPVVHQVFPVQQVVQAHQLMEESRHIGKLILDWSAAGLAAIE